MPIAAEDPNIWPLRRSQRCRCTRPAKVSPAASARSLWLIIEPHTDTPAIFFTGNSFTLADISVEQAWSLLTELTQRDVRGLAAPLLDSRAKRRLLRDAVLVAAASPHPPSAWDPATGVILLGLLASDARLAARALRDWTEALGLPPATPESRVPGCPSLPSISGPVYIKYNSGGGLCYATRYDGRDRGVLLQLGSVQVGHLPLGLHDEDMAAPPPQIV
jgi:hypothetical protein